MGKIPAWKRPVVDWPDAVRLRGSQLGQVMSDVRAGAGLATRTLPARAVEIADQTRSRCEQLPAAMLGELRRRLNILDLATKQDVVAQSKLGRNRVSFVLKEFLEAQRGHDEVLAESLRLEMREELRGLVAALEDDLAAIDAHSPSKELETQQRPAASVDDVSIQDDEIDVAESDDWISSTDSDATNNDVLIRRSVAYDIDE